MDDDDEVCRPNKHKPAHKDEEGSLVVDVS